MALPKAALLLFSCVLVLIGVTSYEVNTLEPCHHDETIWLGSNDKSAIDFSIGKFKFNQQFSGDAVFKCSFHIEADRNEKIIAVIQRMDLRGGNDHHCVDYVEFSDVPKLSFVKLYDRQSNVKKQFCGKKNVSIMTLPDDMVLHAYNKYTLPQNVYITNRNELKVKVVISRMAMRAETLDFQIIFTAAKMGSECKDRTEFNCGNNTCIWKGFYKDGFVNCPYVNCPDEDGCEGPVVKYSSGIGTTIIVCAVVSMLSVLGMFLFCLFICRRCKVLCWSHRTPSTRDPATRVHVSSSLPNETIQPSAPPLISLHDKDLPPSYDSLFPARITETEIMLMTDEDSERCWRFRNVSSHTVRNHGQAMRGFHRRNGQMSALNQNDNPREGIRNRGTNRRHPYNRPDHHGPSRGRYIRSVYHRPDLHHIGRNNGHIPNGKRKKLRNRVSNQTSNRGGRIGEQYGRRRTRSETADYA